jgi:ABC-type molybdenum transport system ATPase subunit/photorepair protein PhrA
MSTAINFDNVTLRHDGVEVLKNVSFKAEVGQKVALLGNNEQGNIS